MAKFLFCLPRYHTNAAPWVRSLQHAGHKVSMQCMTVGPTESYAELTPVWHRASRLSDWLGRRFGAERYLFPAFSTLYRHVNAESPDVVIVRGLTRWFMRMMALIALIQGRRLVVYDQEASVPPLSSTWLRRALCRSVGIRHFTPKIDDSRRDSMGAALQIPFGCPYSLESQTDEPPRALQWPPRILMVAKYRERKRHADLLHALARLAGRIEFQLTFCGEEADDRDREYCDRLRILATECGVGARLTFQNNVPYPAMMDVYRNHDLFVLPSVTEPAAVSPLEAVWCGCAAIVARQSGTRAYLPPGETFDFRDGDVADLARAISGMSVSPCALASAQEMCWRRINRIAHDEVVRSAFEQLV